MATFPAIRVTRRAMGPIENDDASAGSSGSAYRTGCAAGRTEAGAGAGDGGEGGGCGAGADVGCFAAASCAARCSRRRALRSWRARILDAIAGSRSEGGVLVILDERRLSLRALGRNLLPLSTCGRHGRRHAARCGRAMNPRHHPITAKLHFSRNSVFTSSLQDQCLPDKRQSPRTFPGAAGGSSRQRPRSRKAAARARLSSVMAACEPVGWSGCSFFARSR